jgi:toxin-antitoxin system PIN domain toxin
MIFPDINLLLYAYNGSDHRHRSAKRWLVDLLSGDETIGFSSETINGFIRIATNPKAFPFPISLNDAFDIVKAWLSVPNVLVLTPTDDHINVLKDVSIASNARGPAFSDAVLAALAIQHGATFATSDKDFERFQGLKTVNPLSN